MRTCRPNLIVVLALLGLGASLQAQAGPVRPHPHVQNPPGGNTSTGLASVSDVELVKLLGNDTYQVREQALRELRSRGQRTLPALMHGFVSKDEEIASRCAELVTAIGDAARPSLEALLKNSKDKVTVTRAREILGRMRGRSWMGVRIRDLLDHSNGKRTVQFNAWPEISGAWQPDETASNGLPGDEAIRIDVPDREGVLVTEVIPDTPAADAGMKANDFIIGFNGTFRPVVVPKRPDVKPQPVKPKVAPKP